jgi:hypothetical protein
MSTAHAIDPIRSLTLPSGWETARPDLQVVPGRAAQRPRVLAAGALFTGVTCVLAAQLLVSIQTAQGAYTVDRLQATSTALTREQQVRAEALETLASPQHLAKQAAALGMVPAGYPAYLRLTDGRVVGGRGTAGTGAASIGTASTGTASTAAVDDVPNALLTSH